MRFTETALLYPFRMQGVVVLEDDSALIEDCSSCAAVQGNAFKAW
jgi:hypothetical protein